MAYIKQYSKSCMSKAAKHIAKAILNVMNGKWSTVEILTKFYSLSVLRPIFFIYIYLNLLYGCIVTVFNIVSKEEEQNNKINIKPKLQIKQQQSTIFCRSMSLNAKFNFVVRFVLIKLK